jgi:hypothetical protein
MKNKNCSGEREGEKKGEGDDTGFRMTEKHVRRGRCGPL